ncbi:MAG: hypothetical protein R3F07_12045 [Opitutaceae bacterium]
MITLSHDQLEIRFPEVHPKAKLSINFRRTLRIPDDGKDYPLPPGLGQFPLRHTEDHTNVLDSADVRKGGVILPIYQSEALWIRFEGSFVRDHDTEYPFAIQIGTGKVCAVTGEPWTDTLLRNTQNYLVVPGQPWLDGYCVEEGIIRQFVAAPLGTGVTAEEQITGKAEHGGLQIQVYPMKRKVFERRFPKRPRHEDIVYARSALNRMMVNCSPGERKMGLAPGGRMRQHIYRDRFQLEDWDTSQRSRTFVHLLNSTQWKSITGEKPPHKPIRARDYAQAGLPWFDYYDDKRAGVKATESLSKLKGLVSFKKHRSDEDQTTLALDELPVTHLGPAGKRPVQEGKF